MDVMYPDVRYTFGEEPHALAAALTASLQREQALMALVAQQRAEIDHLRSTVNALQLMDAMRGLDMTPPPPTGFATPSPFPSPSLAHCSLTYDLEHLHV